MRASKLQFGNIKLPAWTSQGTRESVNLKDESAADDKDDGNNPSEDEGEEPTAEVQKCNRGTWDWENWEQR